MIDPENKSGKGDLESTANGGTSQSKASTPSTHLDDLHDLFGTPANSASPDEEDPLAQLRDDPNYSALIRDLEYIASQARLLFDSADEAPSDEVWTKIQSQLDTKQTKH